MNIFYDVCFRHNKVRSAGLKNWRYLPQIAEYNAGENIMKKDTYFITEMECDECEIKEEKIEVSKVKEVFVCRRHDRFRLDRYSGFADNWCFILNNSTVKSDGLRYHDKLDEVYNVIYGKCDICGEETMRSRSEETIDLYNK